MLKVFSLVFLLLQLTSVVLARNYLDHNEGINKGGQLVSNNGNYNLVMQYDGNLVIYNRNGHAIWATNTNRGNWFIMQRDGNAVLYDSSGRALWASGTHNTRADFIIMQNDGNLVIYDKDWNPIWATGTNGRAFSIGDMARNFTTEYTAPPDEKIPIEVVSTQDDRNQMIPGEYLNRGEQVESKNGNFRLVLQLNGFLAILDKEDKSIWQASNKPGHKLMFELDGNLVLYDVDGTSVWQSNTKGSAVEFLVLQDDGNLKLIDKNKVVQWETNRSKSGRQSMIRTTTTTTTTTRPTTTPVSAESKGTVWFNKNWEDGNIALVLPLAIDGLDEATKKLVMAHVRSNERLGDAYTQNKFVYIRSWEDLIKRIAGNINPVVRWG